MAHKLGLASLIVTHDVDEALVLADRIYVLHTGGASGENGGAIDAGNPAHAPAHISYELRVERPCERRFGSRRTCRYGYRARYMPKRKRASKRKCKHERKCYAGRVLLAHSTLFAIQKQLLEQLA